MACCCDSAVSGAWWGGSCRACAPGCGLVDFCADGSFHNRYTVYGWEAKG